MDGMLYLHVPFCKGKCIYCDFYSGGNPDWPLFVKAVCAELDLRAGLLAGKTLSSIYFGGGTPSLIPPDVFSSLVGAIRAVLERRSVSLSPSLEFTIEVNPEDVSPALALVWKSAGVNRVSMGVQSLDDSELRFLRRRHSSEGALVAFDILKRHFNNISLDFIFGIPGQSRGSLARSLRALLDLRPEHVSAYALTYEPGTPLVVLRDAGRFSPLPDDACRSLGDFFFSSLQQAGYLRYEVSNFCLPGFESRHNSGYWSGRPYLGLGPSASSYDGASLRTANHPDLKGYIRNFALSQSPVGFCSEDVLSPADRLAERLFLSLRTSRGLDLDAFSADFGPDECARVLKAASKWIDSGHLALSGSRLSLTPPGFWISDFIISSL